jgi:GNAT superfamily N-acetyltransferase
MLCVPTDFERRDLSRFIDPAPGVSLAGSRMFLRRSLPTAAERGKLIGAEFNTVVTELSSRRNIGLRPGVSPTAAGSRSASDRGADPARGGSAKAAIWRPAHPLVRAIVPTDSESYRSILLRTSPEDLYCRFFHVVDHVEECDVKPFVEPRADTIGFIAEDGAKPLGVAHAFFTPNLAEAEIAVVVAQDARRCDIGHALLERLFDELRARKCHVVAYSLSGNSAFSHLARAVGMRPTGPPSDVMTWTLAASS